MTVRAYRKRPIEIEAVQFFGGAKNATEIINWVLANGGTARYHDEAPEHIAIDTLEGTMRAGLRWWVICGVKREFYPCEPEIFEASYDLASSQ